MIDLVHGCEIEDVYNFSCIYCGEVTNCIRTGVSPYGRVKCPKCGKYYKCYVIRCRFCGKTFTPRNKLQEEIKKCPECVMNCVNTPLLNENKIML